MDNTVTVCNVYIYVTYRMFPYNIRISYFITKSRITSHVYYRYRPQVMYCCIVVNNMQCVFNTYCTFSCNIRNRVPYFVTMYCIVLCVFICRYICTINLLLLYQLKIQYHVHVIFRTHVVLPCTYTSVILLYSFVSYYRVPTFL